MNRLLILLALAGLSAAACSTDTTDTTPTTPARNDAGSSSTQTGADASTSGAVTPVSRGQQVTNLAAECTTNTDCKGAGQVTCLHDLGMLGGSIPGGYCTAECQVDDECGKGGACPIADISRDPTVMNLLQQFGGLSLTTFIPSQCYATCDKTAAKPCARADQTCSSLIDVMASQGGNMGGFSAAGLLGQFAQAKQTFCFPPIQLPMRDGGVPGMGDAGAPTIIRGMDAGT